MPVPPVGLEEIDSVPAEPDVEDGAVPAVPPTLPPICMELAEVAPPLDAVAPVPELPASATVPPADASRFTCAALLLQASPSAHARTIEPFLVFMGTGTPELGYSSSGRTEKVLESLAAFDAPRVGFGARGDS